jgi:hypothetical protein
MVDRSCKNVRCGSSREITAEVFGSRERDSKKTENTERQATKCTGINNASQPYNVRTTFAFIQVLLTRLTGVHRLHYRLIKSRLHRLTRTFNEEYSSLIVRSNRPTISLHWSGPSLAVGSVHTDPLHGSPSRSCRCWACLSTLPLKLNSRLIGIFGPSALGPSGSSPWLHSPQLLPAPGSASWTPRSGYLFRSPISDRSSTLRILHLPDVELPGFLPLESNFRCFESFGSLRCFGAFRT